MVPSHRRALRARLLSFRYFLRIGFSTRRLVVERTKSWPGRPRPTLPRWWDLYIPSIVRARRAIEIATLVSGSSSCKPVKDWMRSTR